MVDVEQLYRESAADVERCVRRRFSGSSVPDAVIEDACAQAWVIAWRHRERIEPENPVGWVIVVAVNEVYGLLRKRRMEIAEELVEGEPARSQLGDPEAALEARAALAALSGLKRQQCVVLALKAAGFRYTEIQAITGTTYTWVNRHVSEGMKALRETDGR